MADVAGEVSTTLGGLSSDVDGSIQWWRASVDTPDEWVSPTVAPSIFTQQDSADGSSADVQLQVSSVNTFATTVHDSDLTQPHNTSQARQITGLADGFTYYLRARVKKTLPSGNYVSAWSPVTTLSVVTKSGIASANITMNIGVEHTPETIGTHYAYMNVGVKHTPMTTWPVYAYMNVGVMQTLVDHVPQYIFIGDVNTATPNPVIWFLRPSYGREGDGISLFGFGFGDLQSTFNGVVEINWGGTRGWEAVPIIAWQTFPATPDAYTVLRSIDESVGLVDPQHTVIEITIPSGAIPPGYPVRVRTDGP